MGCILGKSDDKDEKTTSSGGNSSSSSSSSAASKSVTPPAVPGSKGATSTWTSEWEESKWIEDTRSIWLRSLKDLPVHMDLPRLAARLCIYNNGTKVSETVASDTGGTQKVELVHSHLRCLAEQVGDQNLVDTIDAKFWEYVHKDGSGDVSQQLLRFLVEVVTDKSPVGGILRALHQKIVFPGFYSIKNNVFDQLPFKDHRGTWLVSVYLMPNYVEVRHRKTQVSRPSADQPNAEFEFDWELQLRMDRQLDEMRVIRVHLKELRIMEGVSDARAQQIRDIFGKFYRLDGTEEPIDEPANVGEESDNEGDEIQVQQAPEPDAEAPATTGDEHEKSESTGDATSTSEHEDKNDDE